MIAFLAGFGTAVLILVGGFFYAMYRMIRTIR